MKKLIKVKANLHTIGNHTVLKKRSVCYHNNSKKHCLLILVLFFLAPLTQICAQTNNYINIPLDANDSVKFYGDYIIYGGQKIELGTNALYVDGSLSTADANNYRYVFNELDDDKANVKALRPYINDAVNNIKGTEANPIKVYFAPWVYWTDNPDDPTISTSSGEKNRHGLNGAELNVTYVEFIGLTKNYDNVIICGNRGQSNGSDGNWNILNLKANSFYTKNITYANYCTVDLVFPLKPVFNRKRRTNNGVQAQLFGFSSIKGKVWADNCAFVSRLNLCPPAGDRTLYTNCHFESTDDSLIKGVYLNCDFDFYGSMPFYSINGAVLLNSKFKSESTNESSVQYMTKKQTSGVIIDGAFTCTIQGQPISKRIEWTKVPPEYLRSYQASVTLNDSPINMSGEVPGLSVDISKSDALKAYKIETKKGIFYNTYNLLRGSDNWDPLRVRAIIEKAGADNIPTSLTITPNKLSFVTQSKNISLSYKIKGTAPGSEAQAGSVIWAIAPDYASYSDNVKLIPSGDGKTCLVQATNNTYAPINVIITATSSIGLQGASLITITPEETSAPRFKKNLSIIPPAKGKIGVNYQLALPDTALSDQSLITWYRLDNNSWHEATKVSVSRLNIPELYYKLEPGDVGKYLGVEIRAKHNVSATGKPVRLIYDKPITNADILLPFEIHTNFRNFPIEYSSAIKPGYWTFRNVSPTTTQLADWRKSGYKEGNEANITEFPVSKTLSGWEFTDAALDGAASTELVNKYGLFLTRVGAQMFYTPKEGAEYMQIKTNLNPEKTAGQGFGSAGQFLDIFIKFDLKLQRGYALRIMRISQGQKSALFYLVEYKADGRVVPLCKPVWSSALISDCLITLTADNSTGKLSAHVESTTPQAPSAILEWTGHPSQEVVDMEANMVANSYGGFGIFDIGSTASKNRHLFRSLDVVWSKTSSAF